MLWTARRTMTTIIGVKADVEPKGIVLAADTQITVMSEDGKKILGKQIDKKIRVGPFWAMADAGDSNRELNQFYANLKNQNKGEKERHPVYAAVNKKRFMEINELNASLRRQEESMEDLPIFVLGVNHPYLGLYVVDEFGGFHSAPKEREIYYVVAGSGGKRAATNIEDLIEEDKIKKEYFTVAEAIQIATDALSGVESRDVQTSGIDLVVLTEKDITEYGKSIRDAIKSAKQKEIDTIKNRYSLSAAQLSI